MPNNECQAAHGPLALLTALTLNVWRRLTTPLCDGYRPERHYMRGPGPKSRARAVAAKAPGQTSAVRTRSEQL